jgi:hypothetical protein
MATSTQQDGNDERDVEARLRRYALAGPSAGLRNAVLARASASAKGARLDAAVGWALAALVVVQLWGGWMERGTATRMAGLGAPPRIEYAAQEPVDSKGWLQAAASQVEMAVLHPRYNLPLGPGVHHTRLESGRIPITSLSAGEAS